MNGSTRFCTPTTIEPLFLSAFFSILLPLIVLENHFDVENDVQAVVIKHFQRQEQ